jgi:hypothetical protein
VARRSRFAAAVEDWIRKTDPNRKFTTREIWEGLAKERPDLTAPSDTRRTPRATCMRDLRKDPAFSVSRGIVELTR